MSKQLGLSVKKKDFSRWYEEITFLSSIIEKRTPNSRGFYSYPFWGTEIFRKMEAIYEEELKKTGHRPIRTPTVIPETLLALEKEHAKGFAPETWTITHGREKKKLEIPKVLRPTGEMIIYSSFKFWVRSWRDLPFKTFETRQIFRAEPDAAILPLLRSHEFFWVEAHDVQSSNEEADKQVIEDIGIFSNVLKKFCLPFTVFKRPEHDKFPGAVYTCAYDIPMPDRKVLQIGSTHNLGQNFSRAIGIKFQTKDEKEDFVYQTCFGPAVSRTLGGLIAIHGDDKGLVLPPQLSPILVIIIPIYYKDKKTVLKHTKEIEKKLLSSGISCRIDDREQYTPGFKFNEWELKGVPIRLEIGPKDIEKKQVVLVRRDTSEKKSIKLADLEKEIKTTAEAISKNMLEKAQKSLKIDKATTLDEIIKKNKQGTHLIEVPFCDETSCAENLKDKSSGIKVRGVWLFRNKEKTVQDCEKKAILAAKGKKCAICSKKAKKMVFLARQY